MVIVVRYLINDWVIMQVVCRLMLLAKSMTGEEMARQIISVILWNADSTKIVDHKSAILKIDF